MGISYAEIIAHRKARSKRRSDERKEVLKTPPKHYMMFIDCSHKDLVNLLHKLIEKKLSSNMLDEIDEQGIRVGGPEIRTVLFYELTRDDLLKVIYSLIADEIRKIDEASMEDLPLLINEEWSCPQLKERLLYRLRGGACRT